MGNADNSFRVENLVQNPPGSWGPFFNVGTNTDFTTFQIGQTDPLNMGAGPLVDLGDIFPTGIPDEEALADYLTLAEYASALGVGGTLDLIVIPEASGLPLFVLGMVALAARRRSAVTVPP